MQNNEEAKQALEEAILELQASASIIQNTIQFLNNNNTTMGYTEQEIVGIVRNNQDSTHRFVTDAEKSTWNAGGGGGLVSYGWLNAEDYGVLPTNTADANTTAMNALIVAAITAKKGIVLGSGVFDFNTIFTNNPAIQMKGAGWDKTTLRSASAVPLFQNTNPGDVSVVKNSSPSMVMTDLTLDGNTVGTIGLDLFKFAYFEFSRLNIINFTNTAINLNAVLIGSFNSIWVRNTLIGVKAVSSVGYDPNLVTFNKCWFQWLSTRAIDWSSAGGLQLVSCDFEECGTAGNGSTGCIKTTNMGTSSGLSLTLSDGWFEANYGTLLDLGPANKSTRTVIQNTQIAFAKGGDFPYIKLDGSGAINKLTIISSQVNLPYPGYASDYITNYVEATGSNAYVEKLFSDVGNVFLGVGAKYIDKDEGTTTVGGGGSGSPVLELQLLASTGVIQSSGSVTAINDQSGHGVNFAAASGNASYDAADADFGHAINFVADAVLQATTPLTANNTFTIFAVVKGNATNAAMLTNRYNYEGLGNWFAVTSSEAQSGVSFQEATSSSNTAKKLMRYEFTPTTMKTYMNGVLQSTETLTASVANSSNKLLLGGYWDTPNGYTGKSTFKMAEVRYYSGTLSPTDITTIESSLTSTYGL